MNAHLILHPDNPLCIPYESVEIIGGDESPFKSLSNIKKKKKRHIRRPCKCKNDTSKLCIACTEKPKDYMCFPCGHVCFCEDCFKKFVDKDTYRNNDENISNEYVPYYYSSISNYCPVCRDYISKIVKIYF